MELKQVLDMPTEQLLDQICSGELTTDMDKIAWIVQLKTLKELSKITKSLEPKVEESALVQAYKAITRKDALRASTEEGEKHD